MEASTSLRGEFVVSHISLRTKGLLLYVLEASGDITDPMKIFILKKMAKEGTGDFLFKYLRNHLPEVIYGIIHAHSLKCQIVLICL